MDSAALQRLQNKQKVAGGFLTDTEASQCVSAALLSLSVSSHPTRTYLTSRVPWAHTLAAAVEQLTDSSVFLGQEPPAGFQLSQVKRFTLPGQQSLKSSTGCWTKPIDKPGWSEIINHTQRRLQ